QHAAQLQGTVDPRDRGIARRLLRRRRKISCCLVALREFGNAWPKRIHLKLENLFVAQFAVVESPWLGTAASRPGCFSGLLRPRIDWSCRRGRDFPSRRSRVGPGGLAAMCG